MTAVGMATITLTEMGGGVALVTRAVSLSCLAIGIAGMAFYTVRGMRLRRRETAKATDRD
ncbi:hypothetical protein [Candidatus Poriferisodalis sp.]|uniref:hypothetical protein n=1 Tax=Candidatus Poriferisodalis sp. TaxID=3101277 RepID=UPI003B52456D